VRARASDSGSDPVRVWGVLGRLAVEAGRDREWHHVHCSSGRRLSRGLRRAGRARPRISQPGRHNVPDRRHEQRPARGAGREYRRISGRMPRGVAIWHLRARSASDFRGPTVYVWPQRAGWSV